MNFPFIRSNIPATPTYGVCIFQLIRHSGADGSYHDFLDRGFLITRKLLNPGLLADKLKSLLWKYILIKRYEIYPFLVITIRSFPRSWLITGIVARVTQYVSLLEHLCSLPICCGVGVARSFVFYVMICRSLFVLLTFLSIGHGIVCSSIKGFWLPFRIFKPCLFFLVIFLLYLDLRFLINR